MLNIHETMSSASWNKESLVSVKHCFGTKDDWRHDKWSVLCSSGTYIFGGCCFSYSEVRVSYGDEEKFVFGGDFRDGFSELNDKPHLRVWGFEVVSVSENMLVLIVNAHRNHYFIIHPTPD